MVLSAELFSAEKMEFTEEIMYYPKLQRTENSVYRAILQVPTYAANSVLRGGIGASPCYARVLKIKLLFAKHLLDEDRNSLARNIQGNRKC